ncbi:hypothetical protein ACF09E_34605 [Streptomyces sp. NPDC014891]|uniref:hypothetical protein n=1 Tax=Streptomyces sp. NPDC014891 TaxID=3364929 RepID=UPI0036F7EE1C
MPSSSRRKRKPLGYDLFDEPYYKDPYAPPPPPSLPVFTPETLPYYLRTWRQIKEEGLEGSGRAEGLLSWTPRGSIGSREALVWDIRKATVPLPREPDLLELCEQEPEQD